MLGGHNMFTAAESNIAPFGASFDGGLNFTSEAIFLTAVTAPGLFRGVGVNAVCGPELMFNAGTDGDFVATVSYKLHRIAADDGYRHLCSRRCTRAGHPGPDPGRPRRGLAHAAP